MGLTINCTNEFVQSHFSDGVLILRYINKMGTMGGGGGVVVSALRRCKPYWSRVEISPVATEKLAVRTLELMVPALSKY